MQRTVDLVKHNVTERAASVLVSKLRYFPCMNKLAVIRKYCSAVVVAMLNLLFLLILIFSSILLIFEETQTSVELKIVVGTGVSKLYLTYSNWSELYSDNLPYHTDTLNLC